MLLYETAEYNYFTWIFLSLTFASYNPCAIPVSSNQCPFPKTPCPFIPNLDKKQGLTSLCTNK